MSAVRRWFLACTICGNAVARSVSIGGLCPLCAGQLELPLGLFEQKAGAR